MLPLLTFRPILKERVWGGRKLVDVYHKPAPDRIPLGESWEITDRPEGVSVVAEGPLIGRTLRTLMETHRAELLGEAKAPGGRFPLLVKLLDAREKLSLQVHPPASLAAALGGEPKTEMWYVAEATPEAAIYVGLRHGVTREEFTRRAHQGTVEACFHRLPVRAGDAMFLPSGRVHALGGGCVIFEIQQNSDTTYRVFDWNRLGLDGKPRELHVEESLRCIDFNDFEPALLAPTPAPAGAYRRATLVADPLFGVEHWATSDRASTELETQGTCLVLGVISGELELAAGAGSVSLGPGEFAVVPACLAKAWVQASGPHAFLLARPGRG